MNGWEDDNSSGSCVNKSRLTRPAERRVGDDEWRRTRETETGYKPIRGRQRQIVAQNERT